MKKGYWIALTLILVLAVGMVVAACGSSTSTTTGATTATTAAPVSTETTASSASTETTAPPASTDTTAAANTAPLKFGVAISLTGVSAAATPQIKEALDTEVKYTNANGGIKGRQVQLIYIDDQSNIDTAMAAITSLVDQKCDIIIGPFPDFVITATRSITEQAKVLQIPFTSVPLDELVSDQTKWPYYFAPCTGPDGCSDAFVRALQADGRKNVLGVGDQMPISAETLQILNKSLPASDIKFTLMSDSWSLSETDVTPIANKIAAKAKDVKPDAIVLCSNPVHVNQMTKILRSLGVTAPIYNEASGAHPLVTLAQAGNDPKNVVGDYTIGPPIVDPSQLPDTYPAKADLAAFLQRWKADNPKEYFASFFVANGYDTFHLAKLAIETATTQDEAGYAAALAKIDYWGAQGHFVFSDSDHVGAHGGMLLWQYTEKGLKLVRDLNTMTDPTLLPATVDAMATFKK